MRVESPPREVAGKFSGVLSLRNSGEYDTLPWRRQAVGRRETIIATQPALVPPLPDEWRAADRTPRNVHTVSRSMIGTEFDSTATLYRPAAVARRVTVILVNWNGWPDTILCLQSVFASANVCLDVIVCDNGSTDDSLANITMWAEGRLSPWVSPSHPARDIVLSSARPRSFAVTRPQDETGPPHNGSDLVLIAAGSNLGFGGGNNVGMASVMARGTSDFVWLLNNDTTVGRDSLCSLVAAVEDEQTRVLASSRVMFMGAPDQVWFEGGIFGSFTATARHVPTEDFAVSRTGFLSGCALLIGRAAWETIGLLDAEQFFMYGEDIDYSLRARAAHIPLRVVRDSVVLHAVSASSTIASPFAYRHNVASVIRVSRKHFAAWRAMPIIFFHLAKLGALAVVRRPGMAALRGYWQGMLQGFA